MGELSNNEAIIFVQNNVEGDVVVCNEGVSFWGGVDPETGVVIDIHLSLIHISEPTRPY